MVYISPSGQVLESRPWSFSSLVDMFWGFVGFMTLYFKTLIDPNLNKKGESYATDYRSTGGRGGGPPGGGPRRRFGGFNRGQGGAGSPPMAGGG